MCSNKIAVTRQLYFGVLTKIFINRTPKYTIHKVQNFCCTNVLFKLQHCSTAALQHCISALTQTHQRSKQQSLHKKLYLSFSPGSIPGSDSSVSHNQSCLLIVHMKNEPNSHKSICEANSNSKYVQQMLFQLENLSSLSL